jgi:hypothetical protein
MRRTASNAAQTTVEAGKSTPVFALPVASAAAGLIGGVMLERGLKRRRKVLGISLPRSRDGLVGLTKQIGEAGKQFGRLASEVRTTRKKAEEIGKAIS